MLFKSWIKYTLDFLQIGETSGARAGEPEFIFCLADTKNFCIQCQPINEVAYPSSAFPLEPRKSY